MRKYHPIGIQVRYTNVCEIRDNAGTLKTPSMQLGQVLQGTGADGDKLIAYVYLSGGETKISVGTNKNVGRGIFDLYINDTIDSSGYDDYNASSLNTTREITITAGLLKPGINKIELRVNGKNISSTGYNIACNGIMCY